MTLREFRTAGRWGCARCYATFEQSMRELLRRVHGSSRHVGRNYRPPEGEGIARASELTDLREQLRRAIESEQFELAADLRDKIRVLE
jgi:protein arginine kinase activator